MIYAYIRVSTTHQDCDNQKVGILAEAQKRGLTIDHWIIDDGISGSVDPSKRNLGKLLKRLGPGDTLIAGEISRLGRSLFMVMRMLEYCLNAGVKVYTAKDGYELDNNVQSKVLAFAFGLAAEIERTLISERTREALVLRRAQGIMLGRPVGAKTINHKLDKWRADIVRWREKGWSKAKIARKCHVVDKTLRKYMKAHDID